MSSRSLEATKGSGVLTTESLRSMGFGLYGYFRDAGNYYDGADPGHLLIENATMEYIESVAEGDRWHCTPAAYWPLGASVSFFAYAPRMNPADGVLVIPALQTASMPGGTYTVPADPKEQPDLCLAAPVLDWSAAKGDVPLRFSHALTRVLFFFNADGTFYEGNAYRFKVKSLRLDGIAGQNSFAFDSWSGFRWDNLPRENLASRTGSYALSLSEGTLADAFLPLENELTTQEGLERFVQVNKDHEGILYLLPQPMTTLGSVTVELAAYRYDDASGNWVEDDAPVMETAVIPLPDTTVWQPGTTVCYSATLDATYYLGVQFRVTLLDWEGNAIEDVEFNHE